MLPEMLPLSTAQWNNIHPFAPLDQAQGYQEMLTKLEQQYNYWFAGTTKPNSGAQGEYAGLMVIEHTTFTRRSPQKHCLDSIVSTRNKSCVCCYGWNESSIKKH
jgi:glycine cleavage system protein P-like pyridoxal-binding family